MTGRAPAGTPPASPPLRYLIADDDDTFRGRLARALASRGAVVTEAATAAEAAAACASDPPPDRVVLDLRMPGGDGMRVLRGLGGRTAVVKVVVLTGYGTIPSAVEAVRLGAHNYLTKPADADDVLGAFETLPGAWPAGPNPSYPALAEVEREYLARVLAEHGGNVTHAAKALGMHRRSLQRKLGKSW